MMIWFAAAGIVALSVLTFLFWPTPGRRYNVHAILAQQAAANANWAEWDRQVALSQAAAQTIGDDAARATALADIAFAQASIDHHRGRFEDAVRHLDAAIGQAAKIPQPDQTARLYSAHHLRGVLHLDSGDLDMAAGEFRSAARFDAPGGPGLVIFSLQRLADVLLEKQEFGAAREVIEQCAEQERSVLSHPANPGQLPAKTISMTAPDLSLANRDFPRAEALFREKVDHWRSSQPVAGIDVTRYQLHLATALAQQNKLAEAHATLDEAHSDVVRILGATHPRALRVARKRDEIASLYRGSTQ